MGAIVDRLAINLQDVKQWLRIPLTYQKLIVDVLADPAADTEFLVLITRNEGTKYEFSYTSDLTPTVEEIAAGLVLLMQSTGSTPGPLPGTAFAVSDLGSGRYQVVAIGTEPEFQAYVNAGQSPEPVPESIDDQILSALLETAKVMADEYCNNPFTDDDGNDEPIPAPVKTGVLQLVDWLYADYSASAASSSGSAGPSGPIKKRKAADVEITYATPSEVRAALGARGSISDLPGFATVILTMYRLTPGFEAAREPRPKPFGLAQMNDNVGFTPGDDFPEGE